MLFGLGRVERGNRRWWRARWQIPRRPLSPGPSPRSTGARGERRLRCLVTAFSFRRGFALRRSLHRHAPTVRHRHACDFLPVLVPDHDPDAQQDHQQRARANRRQPAPVPPVRSAGLSRFRPPEGSATSAGTTSAGSAGLSRFRPRQRRLHLRRRLRVRLRPILGDRRFGRRGRRSGRGLRFHRRRRRLTRSRTRPARSRRRSQPPQERVQL